MKRKLRLTTLGVELAQETKHPDGCPILKAWRGTYSPAFNQAIQETLDIVDHEDADGFLLPSNFSFYSPKRLQEIGAMVSDVGLPSIGCDLSGERRKPIWLDYIIRFSWYRSIHEPGVILSPSFLNSDGFDLMAEMGIRDWQPTEKEPLPSVSFCGREGGTLGLTIWEILPKSITRRMAANFFCGTTHGFRAVCAFPLRVDAMRVLQRDSRVKTNFIGRGKVGLSPRAAGDSRRQFLDNLMGNAYALCVRGSNNQSWRFYEALSLGKIPILIDTNCILPLEDEIPWDRLIVRVPSSQLHELPDRLVAFHSRLSSLEFCQLQKELRSIFERLTPARFYPQMLRKVIPYRKDTEST